MRLLSTFFPNRPRPRTLAHAGKLLLSTQGGAGALRRYLRFPREREILLAHHGQEPLREVAEELGVIDIALEQASDEVESLAAGEMALALGAERLDFVIDEEGVRMPGGGRARELTVTQADELSHDPAVRPRIQADLRAACAALRQGLTRVRIGDPAALLHGRATVIRPDPAMAGRVALVPPRQPVAAGAASHPRPFVPEIAPPVLARVSWAVPSRPIVA